MYLKKKKKEKKKKKVKAKIKRDNGRTVGNVRVEIKDRKENRAIFHAKNNRVKLFTSIVIHVKRGKKRERERNSAGANDLSSAKFRASERERERERYSHPKQIPRSFSHRKPKPTTITPFFRFSLSLFLSMKENSEKRVQKPATHCHIYCTPFFFFGGYILFACAPPNYIYDRRV